jgi:hypothetical protein
MQMQLSFDVRIPDGILAANALLAENSHQGFVSSTHTVHQGFGFVISHTSLGMMGSLYDGDVRSRCTGKERDTTKLGAAVTVGNRAPRKGSMI